MCGFALALALATLPAAQAPLPPVSYDDLGHLPDQKTAEAKYQFACDYCAFLLERYRTHGWGCGLQGLYDEACWRRDVWSALRDAHMGSLADVKWWENGDQLRWLRSQIGVRNFYLGVMPDPAPRRGFYHSD